MKIREKKSKEAKKKFRIITRTDIVGSLFVLPFLMGFIWLFLRPLIEAVRYSFNRVTMGSKELALEAMGWENYRRLLFGDAEFVKGLSSVFLNMGVKVLVILFLSMFLAILLKAEFPGRLLFRGILFLPVIFNADIVMSQFSKLDGDAGLSQEVNSYIMMGGELTGFVKELIDAFGILAPVMEKFTSYAATMFDLLWDCGIQIILFIIGLQAIPDHLYEVAEIEGGSKWEIFWKITFPLLTPSIMLCLIFTLIRYFNARNVIVNLIDTHMLNNLGYACAMSLFYALLVLLLVMIVYKILSRKTIYLD